MQKKLIGTLVVGDIFALSEKFEQVEIEDVIESKVAPRQVIFRLRCFDGSPYFFSSYHKETEVFTWTFEEILATV